MRHTIQLGKSAIIVSLIAVTLGFALQACNLGGDSGGGTRSRGNLVKKAADAVKDEDAGSKDKKSQTPKSKQDAAKAEDQTPHAETIGSGGKPFKKPVDDKFHEPNLDPGTMPQGETPAGEEPAAEEGEAMEEPKIAELRSAVGIKNFRQVSASMSSLTGIPESNATVKPVFDQLTTQLPESNDIRSFLASHQVAIAKLAVEYCDALISNAQTAAVVLPGVNLNQAPSAALNAAGREMINKALITRFWGPGLADVPKMDDALVALSALTDQLLEGKDVNSAALTPNLVKGLCTAVLASGPVTFQ